MGSNKVNISLTVDPDKMKADTKMVKANTIEPTAGATARAQVTWPSPHDLPDFRHGYALGTTGDHHGLEHSESNDTRNVTREDLVALLNEDLAGEYQAIISYVIYSQVLKGAQYMNIAAELQTHAAEELAHALMIAGQIDYLGRYAVGGAEASENFGQGRRHAALRLGERE